MVTEKQRNNLRPWKKGQSGNPNGRPPKPSSIISILKEELRKPSGLKEGESWEQAIVRLWLAMVGDGDMKALKELLDRIYGKPAESLQLSGPGGKEITLRVKYDNGG